MNAQLFLSQDGSQPMYRQIVERITTKVATREWVAGTALPSIRELAAANSVSVITVKRAYLELELAKVIVTQHGKGSFVGPSTDLPRQLMYGELRGYVAAALRCAAKLELSINDLKSMLDDQAAESRDETQQGNTE
ncbi:MAG: GntR family transcriptional regulator [Casimicrobium sp.]